MASFLKTITPVLPSPTQRVVTNPVKKRGRGKKQPVVEPLPLPLPKPNKKKHKQKIPAALREQVWITRMGRVFEGKCPTTWCNNTITVFDFQSGHDIPESKGGPTTLNNLIPLCSRCNLSMGDTYTIQQWSTISNNPLREEVVQQKEPAAVPKRSTFSRLFHCFSSR